MNLQDAMAAAILFLIAGPAAAATNGPAADPLARETARQILADVRAQMPARPLHLTGELRHRPGGIGGGRTLNLDVFADFSGPVISARYTVRDAFGRNLEQLRVRREPGRPAAHARVTYDPPATNRVVELGRGIRETDVTWADLTMDFLWWPDAVAVGVDEVKGETCTVLDVRPPAGTAYGCAGIRLWIAHRAPMLLQATAHDEAGRPSRQLSIRSLKRVEDQWMVKDLLVRNLERGTSTSLRVDEIRVISTP